MAIFEWLEKPKMIIGNAKTAKEFLRLPNCPNQRPLSDIRCGRIQSWIDSEDFRTAVWASAFCKQTGEEYIVNGQHTATIISKNGSSINVVRERYSVDTKEDVAKLYATFDSKDSARSTGDINQSVAGSHSSLCLLHKRCINLAVTGIAWSTWEMGSWSRPPIERALLMLEQVPFVLFVNDILFTTEVGVKKNAAKSMKRAPVVTAMHRTYQKAQKDSKEFWVSVRDASGPNPNSPDRLLSRWLDRVHVNNNKIKGTDKVDFREMAVKCIHAWNAYRKQITTDMKYFPKSPFPKAV